MKKAYVIAEQCFVGGLKEAYNPKATESVVIQSFGVYLDKKNAIKILKTINRNAKETLGKRASKYSLKTINIRG